ncbi:MAG: beta-eliminating lyase-related protein, partial [Promethearchaeota archaeon]
ARIFNAAVASGTPASKLVENADSVQMCLSKGLGCPVGSLIVGTEEFIHKARKNRKILGGGMRQAGIIAAPGIYALHNMIDRLAEDHMHAKLIANELAKIPNIQLKPVETNLIIADLSKTKWTAPGIAKEFENKGIKVSLMGEYLFRMVTYLNISRSDIDTVVAKIPEVFQ